MRCNDVATGMNFFYEDENTGDTEESWALLYVDKDMKHHLNFAWYINRYANGLTKKFAIRQKHFHQKNEFLFNKVRN